MEKNLDHLTSEEIETLMQRYYAGESVSKLTKEYGISVRSSNLYKLFPPGKVKNGAEPEHPKYETYAARPLAA